MTHRWNTTLKHTPGAPTGSTLPVIRLLHTPGSLGEFPRHPLGDVVVVGRAVDSPGIGLPDDARASRNHARLEVSTAGMAQITDLKSSTGTWLNGERVTTATLSDGDVLRLGDSFLIFRNERPQQDSAPIDGLLGDAPAMQAIRRTLALLGRSPASVLLLGETGTGKEVAARALHDLSRRKGPFVAVNCGAIPESLAEAQFFGHLAGSFTNAKTSGEGFFRAAHGGTLFLDEVGELPAPLQPKLLRALEQREVIPVGGTRPIQCDVRIVTATNRNLLEATDDGSFRPDLYARIAELTAEMPALRERREDILPILDHFLTQVPTEEGIAVRSESLDGDVIEALLLHDWRFNVRELRRTATRLTMAAQDGMGLRGLSLVNEVLDRHSRRPAAPADGAPTVSPESGGTGNGGTAPPLPEVPDRARLEALLRTHAGVVADVARETKRSRKQVYRWLEQHGLDPANYRN